MRGEEREMMESRADISSIVTATPVNIKKMKSKTGRHGTALWMDNGTTFPTSSSSSLAIQQRGRGDIRSKSQEGEEEEQTRNAHGGRHDKESESPAPRGTSRIRTHQEDYDDDEEEEANNQSLTMDSNFLPSASSSGGTSFISSRGGYQHLLTAAGGDSVLPNSSSSFLLRNASSSSPFFALRPQPAAGAGPRTLFSTTAAATSTLEEAVAAAAADAGPPGAPPSVASVLLLDRYLQQSSPGSTNPAGRRLTLERSLSLLLQQQEATLSSGINPMTNRMLYPAGSGAAAMLQQARFIGNHHSQLLAQRRQDAAAMASMINAMKQEQYHTPGSRGGLRVLSSYHPSSSPMLDSLGMGLSTSLPTAGVAHLRSLSGPRSNTVQRRSVTNSLSRAGNPSRNTTNHLQESCVGIAARLLPMPKEAGGARPVSQRRFVPLATDEDQNWLSEFLCFVRSDLLEVFRASMEDVRSRNSSKKVMHGQVGIRCRHCAHLPQHARTARSSSYPKTLSRIYQSLTMMLRDHFGACSCIPLPLKLKFQQLKGSTSQGATGSNNFWEYSAKKLGLKDSASGIWVDEDFDSDEWATATFEPRPTGGAASSQDQEHPSPQHQNTEISQEDVHPLATEDDLDLASEFLFTLLSQHTQLIFLEESEKIGNRKNLQVGLAGIGCRHCCRKKRMGLCRLFPARRRTLPGKISDLYDHVRRCTLCPKESRDRLVYLKKFSRRHHDTKGALGEREFYDRVWVRMGYGRPKGAEK